MGVAEFFLASQTNGRNAIESMEIPNIVFRIEWKVNVCRFVYTQTVCADANVLFIIFQCVHFVP